MGGGGGGVGDRVEAKCADGVVARCFSRASDDVLDVGVGGGRNRVCVSCVPVGTDVLVLAQGDEFFGTGGVDGERGVKVGFASAHAKGHSEALDDLVGVASDEMDAEDVFIFAVDDQLHGGFGFVVAESVEHVGELGGVDLDVFVARAGFAFGETDGSDGGMRKDRAGDLIVELACVVVSTKEAVSEFTSSSDRKWRKGGAFSHITEGIDPLGSGILESIDNDMAFASDLDACGFEADIAGEWDAANSPQQTVVTFVNKSVAAIKMEFFAVFAFDGFDGGVKVDVDTLGDHLVA